MTSGKNYPSHSLQPNFKPVDSLFENRLRQFIDKGGQYLQLNLPHLYDKSRLDTNTEWVNIKVYRVPDDKHGKTQRPLFKDIDFKKIRWGDANKGMSFGPSWKTFWFKVEWLIPEDWIESKNGEIHFEWDCDNEGLLYTEDGLPLQAFTGGNERSTFKIPEKYQVTGVQRFYLEIACNGMFGISDQGNPDPNRYFYLSKCELVLPNLTARALHYDFWIISDAAREFPSDSKQKWQANTICNQIMDAFDPEDESTLDTCRLLAKRYLGDDIDSDKVFHTKPPLDQIDVYGVGNCHIDTAWLWPFAETKRKIVRSWTTQLKICDEYPEYIFVASQMQQFKWLKKYHPEISEKIQQKFATNQFLPIGGSWVENDTNLPNGESLIRQFLLGQNYQLNEFGIKSDIFWLPDTFGYSSQIPQICQLVGINKFVTQKLSWNNINQFPLSTFNWVGIDGSQVLVHMPPANTYTADANFGDVVRSQRQHKNLRDVPTGMLLYGKGDGGGGPTEDMLEKLRRCRGVANTSGSIPTLQLGVTPDDFFADVLKKSQQGLQLPSWCGEIYLEFHRGTYTTQADIKKYMRQGEIKLHDLEWIATLLSLTYDYKYPKRDLQNMWEDLCLCQFHDVLPGSCIGEVYYEEAKPMLRKVLAKADQLIKDAVKSLHKLPKGTELSFINTLPWSRNEIVEVTEDKMKALGALAANFVTQRSNKGQSFISVLSDTNLRLTPPIKFKASVKQSAQGEFVLSNELIKATISKNGVLISLYDIRNKREIIDPTPTKQTLKEEGQVVGGNQFVLFDDEPLNFPAWDTELYSLNKFKFLDEGEVSILESGPLKSSLLVRHNISKKSWIKTEISVEGLLDDAQSVQNNFVKFSCDVEWHETYKFLKVQFPTTIYTAQVANYETQFGITQRPTHFNTSWDVAKFEVCHHKFMDLSEFNYGVSILNDSKYGGAIHGNLIRLSLLRSPKAPDEKADMGSHHFEYAIYPHAHSLGPDTVQLGYNFNHKVDDRQLEMMSREEHSKFKRLVTLESKSQSLILAQIKRGENDEDLLVHENLAIRHKGHKTLIIRVYEALGGSSSGILKLDLDALKVSQVFKVNALEEDLEELQILSTGEVEISLKGFEISTFKIVV